MTHKTFSDPHVPQLWLPSSKSITSERYPHVTRTCENNQLACDVQDVTPTLPLIVRASLFRLNKLLHFNQTFTTQRGILQKCAISTNQSFSIQQNRRKKRSRRHSVPQAPGFHHSKKFSLFNMCQSLQQTHRSLVPMVFAFGSHTFCQQAAGCHVLKFITHVASGTLHHDTHPTPQ